MAIEYRGEEILFAVEIPAEKGETLIRPFNQTGGSTSIEADEIELDTKDKTGSDYGKITQTISLEGIITEGDTFPDYVKKAIRNKDRKSTRLNSSHVSISYAVFCLKKKKKTRD